MQEYRKKLSSKLEELDTPQLVGLGVLALGTAWGLTQLVRYIFSNSSSNDDKLVTSTSSVTNLPDNGNTGAVLKIPEEETSTHTIVEGLIFHPHNQTIGFKLEANVCAIYNAQTSRLLAKINLPSAAFSGIADSATEVSKIASTSQNYLLMKDDAPTKDFKAICPRLSCEMHEIYWDALRDAAKSIAVIINKRFLIPIGTTYQLLSDLPSLRQQVQRVCGKPLSDSTPFYSQPAIGMGTAFLGAKNKIITTGHCIQQLDIRDYYVVFNFNLLNSSIIKKTFDDSEVYSMQKLIDYRCTDKEDWAVVQLEKNVSLPEAKILKRSSKPPVKDTTLFVIGHPCGLPKKVNVAARLTQTPVSTNPHRFFVNIDTFHGNSGSLVFNPNTQEVEGILVNGKSDFKVKGDYAVLRAHSTNDVGCQVISDVEAALR